LSAEGQGDGHGDEEPLRHHGHHSSDEEDDGVEPVVAERDGDHEEGDPLGQML